MNENCKMQKFKNNLKIIGSSSDMKDFIEIIACYGISIDNIGNINDNYLAYSIYIESGVVVKARRDAGLVYKVFHLGIDSLAVILKYLFETEKVQGQVKQTPNSVSIDYFYWRAKAIGQVKAIERGFVEGLPLARTVNPDPNILQSRRGNAGVIDERHWHWDKNHNFYGETLFNNGCVIYSSKYGWSSILPETKFFISDRAHPKVITIRDVDYFDVKYNKDTRELNVHVLDDPK